MAPSSPVPNRRVRFEWPDDAEVRWTPRNPELAIAANAVSLLMPHVEPYIVRTVRTAVTELEDRVDAADHEGVVSSARAYASQEAGHHAQHRRFNEHLTGAYPRLAGVERRMASVFGFLRRRSTRFGLAYGAGAESLAFIAARWLDRNQSLMRDGDPTTTTLFMWHLAEEVEHKEVAWDLYEAHGGGRLRFVLGASVATLTLAVFTILGSWTMLRADRRLWSITSHMRLIRWTFGFAFAALPIMAVAALPGHHPRDLVDPPGLSSWLDHLDPDPASVPEWALP